MQKILYNSTEIRNAIKKLFSSTRGEKLVIVGFVGADGDYYLPNPKGVRVICWDKEGATNPDGIRALIKKGATVEFEKNLHMKLYYAKGKGAIITSANLSKNALDDGNLKELGILIESNKIDIKRILGSLSPREWSDDRLKELDKHLLDNPFKGNYKKKGKMQTFGEWIISPARKDWKLGWCFDDAEISKAAEEHSLKHFNVREPYLFTGCKKTDFKSGDWVLTYFVVKKKGGKKFKDASMVDFKWMYVDFVIKVSTGDDYDYEAIEVKKHSNPPFKIDKQFMQAFNKVSITDSDWSAQKIVDENIIKVSSKMVDSLMREYQDRKP